MPSPSLLSNLEFNIVLKDLGDSLTAQNVQAIKYACGPEIIPRSRLNEIITGHQLLAELSEEDVGRLNDPRYETSGESFEFLRCLLSEVARRPDLGKRWTNFARSSLETQSTPVLESSAPRTQAGNCVPSSQASDGRLAEDLLEDIASQLGRDWKIVVRRLGMSNAAVQEIASRERDSMREAAFQALSRLSQNGLTRQQLKDGLRSCHFNALADQYLSQS